MERGLTDVLGGPNPLPHERGACFALSSSSSRPPPRRSRWCAGPAQLCVVRSCGWVWQHYRIDGDADGRSRVYDRQDSFATAARYVVALKRMIRSSRPRLLLAAYKAGPGNVHRYGGRRSGRRRAMCAVGCD